MTHEFIGYLMGLHNAKVCRLFKKLEPLLAKKICIQKDRSLTQEAVIKLLADVTEQPIQGPQKASQSKKNYSGKKKRHRVKVELVIEDNGQILSVSHTEPGRKHDFRIRKENKPLPLASEKYVDSGYQGLQKVVESENLGGLPPKQRTGVSKGERHRSPLGRRPRELASRRRNQIRKQSRSLAAELLKFKES